MSTPDIHTRLLAFFVVKMLGKSEILPVDVLPETYGRDF